MYCIRNSLSSSLRFQKLVAELHVPIELTNPTSSPLESFIPKICCCMQQKFCVESVRDLCFLCENCVCQEYIESMACTYIKRKSRLKIHIY